MKGSIVLIIAESYKHLGISALIAGLRSSEIIKTLSEKGKQNTVSPMMIFLSVLSYKTFGVVE
jgi:hypothetical protein